MLQADLARCFGSWWDYAYQRRASLRKGKGVMRKLGSPLWKLWHQWRTVVTAHRAFLAQLKGVALKIKNARLVPMWNEWRDTYLEIKRQAGVLLRAAQRIRNAKACIYFLAWQQVCVERRALLATAGRMRNFPLSNAFRALLAYADFKSERAEERERRTRAAEWAPDEALVDAVGLGGQFSYGGANAGRQFLGVVEVDREALQMGDAGLPGALDEEEESLSATGLFKERMRAINEMFDEVELQTQELEREIFQPTDTIKTAGKKVSGLRRPQTGRHAQRQGEQKKQSFNSSRHDGHAKRHDGRWPAPP